MQATGTYKTLIFANTFLTENADFLKNEYHLIIGNH